MLLVNDDLVTLALDVRPDQAMAVVDLSGRFLSSHETVVTVADPVASMAKIR